MSASRYHGVEQTGEVNGEEQLAQRNDLFACQLHQGAGLIHLANERTEKQYLGALPCSCSEQLILVG